MPKTATKTETATAADKAKATRAASAATDETRRCPTCRKTLPIAKFPTTSVQEDGTMGRGKVCRSCRDAKKATA